LWKSVKTEPWTPDEEKKNEDTRALKRRKGNTGSDALAMMSKKTSQRDKFLKESGFGSSNDQVAGYIRLASQYNHYKKVETLLKTDCAQAGCVSDQLLDDTQRRVEETWVAMQGIQPYLKPIRVTSAARVLKTSSSISIGQENVATFANEAQLLLQLRQSSNTTKTKNKAPSSSNVMFSPITEKNMSQQKSCRCKKSKCLKLYCECFANSMLCNNTCVCLECRNDVHHMAMRKTVISKILRRNPRAFRPKVNFSPNSGKVRSLSHRRGCNCTKTRCLKKYCDCFGAKLYCTLRCGCINCENRDPSSNVVPSLNARTIAAATTGNVVSSLKVSPITARVIGARVIGVVNN